MIEFMMVHPKYFTNKKVLISDNGDIGDLFQSTLKTPNHAWPHSTKIIESIRRFHECLTISQLSQKILTICYSKHFGYTGACLIATN